MASSEKRALGSDSRRWWALGFLSLGLSLVVVDGTVVAVAVPTIIRDLHIDVSDAQWLTTAYALVFAALLITMGRIGDMYGRKRMFLAGVVVFVGASALAGLAGSGATLILARTAQGVGGAMILPASLSTVNATFRGKARMYAFAVWGSVIAGMAAVGPLVGGWLTTDVTWRWAFYVNIPLGVVVVVGSVFLVPETRSASGPTRLRPGAVLLSAVGTAALVFGLIEGQSHGWMAATQPFDLSVVTWTLPVSPSAAAFVLSGVCLSSFVFVEMRRGRHGEDGLFDLRLFRLRRFATGNIAALLVSFGEFGLLFALPIWLQGGLGYSALGTGLILLSMAVGAFLSGGVATELSRALGPRRVVILGMALETGALAVLALVASARSSAWMLAPLLAVYGLGLGLDSAQLTNVILVDVPPSESGQGSGMQSTFRQVGAALGIAVLGAIFTATLSMRVTADLEGAGTRTATAERIGSSVASTGGIVDPGTLAGTGQDPTRKEMAAAISGGLAGATRIVLATAAAVYLLGLVTASRLPRDSARRDSDGAQAEPEEEAAVMARAEAAAAQDSTV